MSAIVFSLVLIAVIAFGLWYFERYFARKPSRNAGLVMPVAFFIISVVAIIQSAPAVFSEMAETGGIGGAILTLVLSFVIINLPTLFVYVVYYRTRRKMGEERPWPLRPRTDGNAANSKKHKP
ncbi:hypothetical protein [Butyricicoccus sp.]|uniref:hypothetical protein n=1 Tax=Butyricicoccus sp. TaxID=2049021 RepID=UPI003F1632F6